MTKQIEHCYKCLEEYCANCTFGNMCQECGEDTCGEKLCLSECDIPKGCGEQICRDCKSEHKCVKEE